MEKFWKRKPRKIMVITKAAEENLKALWENKEYEKLETKANEIMNKTFGTYNEKELMMVWRFNYWMLTKVLSAYNEKNEFFYVANDYETKEILMEIAWIENKILSKNKHLDNKEKISKK